MAYFKVDFDSKRYIIYSLVEGFRAKNLAYAYFKSDAAHKHPTSSLKPCTFSSDCPFSEVLIFPFVVLVSINSGVLAGAIFTGFFVIKVYVFPFGSNS